MRMQAIDGDSSGALNRSIQPSAVIPPGTMIVEKVMVGGTATFDFTGTPSGSIISNNGTISATMLPGQFTSTESVLFG